MSALLERVRSALEPRYRVDSEIGGGGTARVFLGHDPALDRPVAIKVLRPGRATARAAEAFLEEARTVARLSHPNVVPIHEVGEERGLFYYVMDYMEGETLRARLEAASLSSEESVSVGVQILRALEAAHEAGVIHGDVKPENIILRGERALLGDFSASGETSDADGAGDASGPAAGTPGYMAPEQASGRPLDPRSDLYSVGLVLYEALAGRRWPPFRDPKQVDWSGVPPPVAGVLRRALRVAADERWEDARSFREALETSGAGKRRGRLVGIASVAVIAVLAAVLGVPRFGTGGDSESAPSFDLAMLPCQAIDARDSAVAVQVARVAANALEHLPRVRTVSHLRSFRWWSQRGSGAARPYEGALETLDSGTVTRCVLQRVGRDSFAIDVEFVTRSGDGPPPDQVRSPGGDAPVALGTDLAVSIIRRLRPEVALSEQSFGALSGRPGPAVRSFLLGEDAFQRDARCSAERYYSAAIETDSTFTLARWRRTDVRRYLAAPDPARDDLEWLRSHADELGPVDRSMMLARLRQRGPARLADYRRAIREHPGETYLLFTYGDELFHRGPLWGIAPDSGLAVLRLAAARDSFLAPAYDHLVMSLIRAGDRDRTQRTLEHLWRIKKRDPDPECALFDPALLGHAYTERFEPERAERARDLVFGSRDEGDPDLLVAASRFGGPYLDLPDVVTELGLRLRSSARATRDRRAAGFVAEGLGLWSRGRITQSLARLDSAARLQGGAEGRLQAAEWRVVPPALGLSTVTRPDVEAGIRVLRSLARDSTDARVRLRSRFALGIAGADPRDADGGEGDPARRPDDGGEAARRAELLLAAIREARSGDPSAALTLSESLLEYRDPADEPGPFFRPALYLLRGRWQREWGRLEAADASWIWHEAVDLAGEPGIFAQRGEVGWALGAWADAMRAGVRAELGDARGACDLAGEALRHWARPDEAVDPHREEVLRLQEELCNG